MTQSGDLLALLFQRGVHLTADDGAIRYSLPAGTDAEPILAALAKHKPKIVSELRRINVTLPASSPSTDITRTAFPLSDVQMSFWELEQAIPGSVHSNLCRAFHLVGELDPQRLEAAFSAVQQRHTLLRTSFGMSSEGARQSIRPSPAVSISHHLATGSQAVFEDAILTIASQMFHQSFDLASPPLLRAALICGGPDEHVLIMVAHHIICDAWSLRLLMEDVIQSYQSRAAFELEDHAQLRFGDLVVWEKERLQRGELDGQRRYWALALAPRSEASGAAASGPLRIRTARFAIDLEPRHQQAIRSLCRMMRCTPFIVMAALFGLALRPLLQTDEIALATIVASRTRTDTERIFAPLINTLVLKADIGDDPKVSAWIGRIRNIVLGALQNTDIPFARVADDWTREHHRPAGQICRVMIILEPPSVPISAGSELACSELPLKDLFVSDRTITSFDLTLTLEETAAGMKGALSYKTEIFSVHDMEKLSRSLLFLVENAGEHSNTNVSSFTRS